MKWHWPESLVALLVVTLDGIGLSRDTNRSQTIGNTGWNVQRKLAAREQTKELWYHGFNNYMHYAFPLDELTPLTCSGQGPDWDNPQNIASNDVAGNFSLTLVDVLDTFVVLNDRAGFESAVRNVIDWVNFDVNTKPQVFETTIRVLGGLLSGHIFANQTGQPFYLPWYRGELLSLAHDLGKRLLPAFSTPTGLPYARINLRHGVVKGETVETCTAGAGSLILEFATLSRLTGDSRFERAARRAFFAIWNRRSDIGLVGNTINTWTGDWTAPEVTGIGAGIDSFYEYALKWYILSGDIEFLDVWDDAYASVMRYSRAADGFWYRTVNMKSGDVAFWTVDSLSAFWAGVQVLAGDVENAIKSHMIYYNLWKKHSGLPEVYDTAFRQATSHQYPLRPELVESTWYLYRATKDTFYLDVGERILFDIVTRTRVKCGLTGITDLRSNQQDDRMESFVLSETLKYLFLLFDEENVFNNDDSNYVFTTEGHILTLGSESQTTLSTARKKMRKIESHQCPPYSPSAVNNSKFGNITGLAAGVRWRSDTDYARELVALPASDSDKSVWSPYGWCERPRVQIYSYDFVLSANGQIVPEDLSPSLMKISMAADGFVVQNVTGVRAHIVQRLDGRGYDIRKLGHYVIRPGHIVYFNDSTLFSSSHTEIDKRDPEVQIRFYTIAIDPLLDILSFHKPDQLDVMITAFTAFFGADLSVNPTAVQHPVRFNHGDGLPVYKDDDNKLGCLPYGKTFQDSVIIVYRGECTFLQKLLMAKKAGAAGLIVLTDDEKGINPTASTEDLERVGDISDVAIVVLPSETSRLVEKLLRQSIDEGLSQLMLMVDPERRIGVTDTGNVRDEEADAAKGSHNILYLNGLPLLNTRLMI